MNNILLINATQWVTTYPEQIPSCIGQLPLWLQARDAQLASLHAAAALAGSGAMEELLRRVLWGYFQGVGLFRDPAPIPVEPAAGLPRLTTGVLPLYERWFAESLAVLKDFFHRDGQYIAVVDPTPVDLDACWQAWDEHKVAWARDNGNQALLVLVEACLHALPEILTGKRLATDVLFPDASI